MRWREREKARSEGINPRELMPPFTYQRLNGEADSGEEERNKFSDNSVQIIWEGP